MRSPPCVVGILGAPYSGKGVYGRVWMGRPHSGPRLVYSPVEASDNYAAVIGCRPSYSMAAFCDALMKGARAAVYVPSKDAERAAREFDLFCRVAWECPGARVMAEELSRVTSPSWAPPAWRDLCTSGSHRGIELAGTAQRPAQIDKEFLSACTEIRCYWLKRAADARAAVEEMPVAGEGRITVEEITTLAPLHYVHWTKPAGVHRGVQALPGKKKSAARPRR
jgi:hypothetical protein